MHVFVSGRPSLDLLGTLKWRQDERQELLGSRRDVADWFTSSPLQLSVKVEPADVDRVRDVREALHRTLTAVLATERPNRSDVGVLNELAAGAGPRLRMAPNGMLRTTATTDQALSVIVRDAFDVLANHAPQVRNCAGARCTRLFLDTSPAGTRRWCGMTECGNRAKVAAHRARRRS